MTLKTEQQRAVGYARVSTEQQAGNHHASLETQEAHILARLAHAEYTHVQTFVDVLSGRRDDRPEYQRMVEFVAGQRCRIRVGIFGEIRVSPAQRWQSLLLRSGRYRRACDRSIWR